MKKLLYLIIVGLVAVFTIGCSNQVETDEKEKTVVEREPTDPDMDSLSMVFGDLFGAGMGKQIRTMDKDIDMSRFFKGVEYMANSDTSKHFAAGAMCGYAVLQLFQAIEEECGTPVNKQVFLKHMKTQWLKRNPTDESTPEMMAGLSSELIEQFKSKGSAGDKAAAMDSLCISVGTLYGGILRQQMLSGDSEIDLEEAFKGVEYLAKADTDSAFFNGLQMGVQVVQFFDAIRQQTGASINKDLFLKHLRKNLKKEISDSEMEQMQNKIEPLMNRVIEHSPKATANKKAGKAYLKELKSNKDYVFTESGLAYKVIRPGQGKNFTDNDEVRVIYTGKHLDGTEFDSSRGKPVSFRLNQVIPGFAEMLKLMKPGGKVVAVIPGDLAYGLNGNQGIGPNETLIFEMETVGVK